MKDRNYDLINNNPENISNQIIQQLGTAYLEKYGEKPGFFHSHQGIAIRLKKYTKDSTPESKWLLLADTYGSLVNHNGILANSIINLFERAFNKPVRTSYAETDLSMWEVKSHLRDTAQLHFIGRAVANRDDAHCSMKTPG